MEEKWKAPTLPPDGRKEKSESEKIGDKIIGTLLHLIPRDHPGTRGNEKKKPIKRKRAKAIESKRQPKGRRRQKAKRKQKTAKESNTKAEKAGKGEIIKRKKPEFPGRDVRFRFRLKQTLSSFFLPLFPPTLLSLGLKMAIIDKLMEDYHHNDSRNVTYR